MRLSPDVVAAARAAGCVTAEIVTRPSGTRHYATCSCGYQSTTRTSVALAMEALARHLAAVAGGRVIRGLDGESIIVPASVNGR